MSGRNLVGRAVVAAVALLVLVFGLVLPTAGSSALPVPQATTGSPSPSGSAKATGTAKAKPSATQSDTDVNPADEPDDDGSDTTPDQTGTWLAIGGAAALALLAGLVVVIRKR